MRNAPKTVRGKPYSPPKSDIAQLLDRAAAADAEIADAARVLIATGMRVGELLGLQVADLELRSSQVHVAYAITDGGPGVGVVRKSTKRADWRDVPLTPGAVKG